MDSRKFVYKSKDSGSYSHWDYCRDNKIPYVRIIKSGTKYWKIEFDMASVTMRERFVIISYADHIIPLYKLYAKYSSLPDNKYMYVGGGRNLIFTVHKKDAPDLAEKLFDLLLLLHEHDQKLFDENPFVRSIAARMLSANSSGRERNG